MRNKNSLFFFVVLVMLVSCDNGDRERRIEKGSLPNIILILADDLGYGDTGPYGQQKTETPNLDRLAGNGMRFTDFYSGSPVCAPSRCVLLTGLHTGHAQVRGNDEWAERGNVWSYEAMIADSTLEGQRPLAANTITLGRLLQSKGYKTAVIGKWGLGAPQTEGIPNRQGFDFFYGYNCQRQAHTYYPVHLYRNENREYLDNDTVAPHSGFANGDDPYDPESYRRFSLNDYSPDLMFKEITRFVGENRDNPFFLFWTTTIPHLALQAPADRVNYYHRKFGDEEPYTGSQGYFPARYPHATYAAMISYLDDQIGRLISQLKDLGIYDNTLILFTSDNGPAYNAGTDSPWFVSAGPFRSEYGFSKGFLYEGGIRVPLIVSWPGKIKPASVSGHKAAFWDILPTLCDIAGIDPPADTDGISFMPELRGKKQKKHKYLYWEIPEYGGQQAVIVGNMKAIRKDLNKGNTEFELYDLGSDPCEIQNIAAKHPEIIARVKEIISREHVASSNQKWRYKILDE